MSRSDSRENVLVIAAHPDDEVLGAGGTMAKRAMNGDEVFVVILATGIAARYAHPEEHAERIGAEVEALRREADKAAKILNVRESFFLDYPDNRLDTIPRMDITRSLREILEKIRPSTVYVHHFGDYNWDHRIAFEAALMACRPNAGDFFPERVYAYEVLSSTERGFQHPAHAFCPNIFEDIASTIEAKKNAMLCYETERRAYPHPRSPEAIEYHARSRGNEVGLPFAEAFQLIRAIRR